MNIREDKRGFSLIELIITMAIMAVFAGAIIGGLAYINVGKTKKASAKLNNQITKIQTATMTKKGVTYLYIYRTSDGIYSSMVSDTTDSDGDGVPDGYKNRLDLDAAITAGNVSQIKLCDSSVTIKGSEAGAAATTLNNNNMLKIGYSKGTGSFIYSNNGTVTGGKAMTEMPFYSTIELSGKEKFTIQMVKTTGKHFIKES